MGKLILAMNVSLDGYVDDAGGNLVMPRPSPALFDWWTREVAGHAATMYGARMYGVMRYWDNDDPNWDDALSGFAQAWRVMPKWVVSSTLDAVGENATLIRGDIETQVRALKDRTDGTISVSGPQIAGLMTDLGLIDEYHLVLRPYVLGSGKPLFHGARPPLTLVDSERLDDETLHLTYRPA